MKGALCGALVGPVIDPENGPFEIFLPALHPKRSR